MIASHIHIGHIYIFLAQRNDVRGHTSAPLLYYTNEATSDLGDSGSIMLGGMDAMMS